jgi:hypothetical protein
MNNVAKFRQVLAEQGKEVTLQEAEKLYKEGKSLLRTSKNLSQFALWELENKKIKGISNKDKADAINFYKALKEL